MKTTDISGRSAKLLVAAAVAAVLLTACATAPVKPDAAAEPRAKLTLLQSDPNLAGRAPQALEAADAAVRLAEQPEADKDLIAYRVYMADRKVDIARADAQTRFAEDQRATLTAQREQARLDARTHEVNVAQGQAAQARGDADVAQGQAAVARAENAEQRAAADQARGEANAANQAAANSAQQVADLQSQVDALQARPTDRGLVLTLGDALFSSGRAELQPGGDAHLGRLVVFLNKYPNRTVVIEGYTDSVGNNDYNLGLSERRAGAVRAYLLDQGVSSARMTASGKGASDPVASNDTAAGRQQNRRVEVVISDPSAASR
jgi:outer membrane protein OmpA-like peptidoglycan-associated protein